VKRKSKEDPIFDERKVKKNTIDYRLPIDSSNLGLAQRHIKRTCRPIFKLFF